MRETFFGLLVGAGALLLLLTAAASDMGTLAFGSAAARVLLAGALILAGTWGRKRKAPRCTMRQQTKASA